jgi:hypothetical protein
MSIPICRAHTSERFGSVLEAKRRRCQNSTEYRVENIARDTSASILQSHAFCRGLSAITTTTNFQIGYDARYYDPRGRVLFGLRCVTCNPRTRFCE